MKGVLFAASEGLPFVKSGGLADVIGSLPQYLDHKKYRLAVVMPMYKNIIEKFETTEVTSFHVTSGLLDTDAKLYHLSKDDIDYYFIRHDGYFNRDNMYGYVDDGERFAFYCNAVMEILQYIPFKIDIIHNHDWHTGMIPVICKYGYKDKAHTSIKHVFTIHNLAFQGNYSREMLKYFNLPTEIEESESLKFDTGISFMKAGIMYSDKVTTVSESYAKEILTDEYGEKMNKFLETRKDDLVGIVNGIDTKNWDSSKDRDIVANYSYRALKNKKECKKDVQRRLGLRVADDVLLVGIVSRLTWQKGVSIILEKLSQIMNQDIQLLILGTGDNYIENQFRRIESDYPHRAVFYCGYDEALSHSIYAALDLFLMPSLFEPCGISQLIAMHYGALPLVREVGGLKDTVQSYNEIDKTGTGFSFKNFSGDDLIYMLKYAIEVYYYRKDDWKKLMVNAMKKDVSWTWSAEKYDQLYSSL